MTPTAGQYHESIQQVLDRKLDDHEKRALEQLGYTADYVSAEEPFDRQDMVELGVAAVAAFHQPGNSRSEDGELREPVNTALGILQNELRRAFSDITGVGYTPASPVQIERLRDRHPAPGASSEYRVTFSFQNHTPLNVALACIRAAWPELIQQGWILKKRSVGEPATELVRFTCIETPTMSWAARCALWNERHPDKSFSSYRVMNARFRRISLSITGNSDGLSWYLTHFKDDGGETYGAGRLYTAFQPYEPSANTAESIMNSGTPRLNPRAGRTLDRLAELAAAKYFANWGRKQVRVRAEHFTGSRLSTKEDADV